MNRGKMKVQNYLELMKSVCDYAREIGLETEGLVREKHTPSKEIWVISVSWKHLLDNSTILYNPIDRFKPNFKRELDSPVITGTRREVEGYRRRAEKESAEWFFKKSIAYGGFITPSPEFLALEEVEQVEVALHESFHRTRKRFGSREVLYLPCWEEEHALVAGNLATRDYFRNTPLEQEARKNVEKHLALVGKVNRFYEEISQVLSFRVGEDRRPIPIEKKLEDREVILKRAKQDIGTELGLPINNAFFIYWHYFYSMLPAAYDRVKELGDIKEIINKLKLVE